MPRAYQWDQQELQAMMRSQRKWRLQVETTSAVGCYRCGGVANLAGFVGPSPDKERSIYYCPDCYSLMEGDYDVIEVADETG